MDVEDDPAAAVAQRPQRRDPRPAAVADDDVKTSRTDERESVLSNVVTDHRLAPAFPSGPITILPRTGDCEGRAIVPGGTNITRQCEKLQGRNVDGLIDFETKLDLATIHRRRFGVFPSQTLVRT